MEIEYEVEHDDGSAVIRCLTRCPHRKGNYVGSTVCHLCDHFGGDGWPEENIVTCNYKEEEVDIQDLKKEVEELKAKIAELEKQEKIVQVPEYNEQYWYINPYGKVRIDYWQRATEDKSCLSFHNVYPTKEMAQSALPDITRCNAIIRACRLVEPEFVPDWKNGDKKYYPFFDGKKWIVDFTYKFNLAPAYVSTIKNCERVCALLTKWEVK